MADYPGSGLVEKFDPDFGMIESGDFEATLISGNLFRGDTIPINYSSDLFSTFTVDDIPPGTVQMTSHFSWTLRVSIVRSP